MLNVAVDLVSGGLIIVCLSSATSWFAVQLSKKVNKDMFEVRMSKHQELTNEKLDTISNNISDLKNDFRNSQHREITHD